MVLDSGAERELRGQRAAPPPGDAPPSWLGGESRAAQERLCAFCGESAPPNSSFCPNCGRALTAALLPPHGEALSVLFTDIEDSTQLTDRLGDANWEAIIDEHNDIVREELHRHRGFEVKLTGDGFLIVFADTLDSLRCAARIQARVTLRAAHRGAAWPVRVRMGIHVGDVILRPGGDILGRTVNKASRILSKGDGGMILASSDFVEEVARTVPDEFWVDLGARRIRGLDRRERIWRLNWGDFLRAEASVEPPPPDTPNDDEAFDPFDPVLAAVR